MKTTNKEKFKRLYAENLAHFLGHWPSETLRRMFIAIDRFSFNKDSEAFEKTCKQLGIRHTYKAIRGFIK